MTSMPASRSVRATILIPRSCPSSPTFATRTRTVTTPPAASSGAGLFDPCPEDTLEGPDDLAEGGVRSHRVHQRGHQVHVRVGCVRAYPFQPGGDLLGVALLLDLGKALELTVLHVVADVERQRLLLVSLGELVHPHQDPMSVSQLALELVRGVCDLALEPPVVDCGHDPVEHRPAAELLEVGEDLLRPVLQVVGERLTNQDPPSGSATCGTPLSWAITCWVRSASRAALSVGKASASSYESVCRLWVPPMTPASASTVTRAMFTSGCCAVSETPAVWVWNRSCIDRSS